MALLEPLAAPPSQGRWSVPVIDPATLEHLGEVEFVRASQVGGAVARAREAAPGWAELDFQQRARSVLALRDLLLQRTDEILETLSRDTGRLRVEALHFEVATSCDALSFYARHAENLLSEERRRLRRFATRKVIVTYRPRGVVGLITGWRDSLLAPMGLVAQALMAGNAVVLKPSEIAPLVAKLIEDLLGAAGFPEGVAQVITGDAQTGAALVGAGCDMITYCGSAAEGRGIAEACGRELIPCTLVLGGNNPMIVCADADIELAAEAAVSGAFANAGQAATSIERAYVVEDVAEEFTDRVLGIARQLRQGPEAEGEVDVGALAQSRHLDILDRQVADALSGGAKLLTGGRRNPQYAGYFFEPTVLTDVDPKMEIMRAPTPGPCLPIRVVADTEEALRLANQASGALVATIWTRDGYHARQLARGLSVGTVGIDGSGAIRGMAENPLGGIGPGGLGRVNGEMGLKSFCHVQSIVQPRLLRATPEQLSYPYQERKLRSMKRAMKLLHRSPLGRLFGS